MRKIITSEITLVLLYLFVMDCWGGQEDFVAGLSARENDEYIEAIVHFSNALNAANGEMSQIYNIRGITNYDNGNYAAAMKDYTKAIELDQENKEPYINRGILYELLGDLKRAKEDFNKAGYGGIPNPCGGCLKYCKKKYRCCTGGILPDGKCKLWGTCTERYCCRWC